MSKDYNTPKLSLIGIESVKSGVWKAKDSGTKKEYYVKRTEQGEIDMTKKVSAFDGLDEKSAVVLPTYVGGEDCFPEGLTDKLFPVAEAGRDVLLVVEAHDLSNPDAIVPGQIAMAIHSPEMAGHFVEVDTKGIPLDLGGKPLTQTELDDLQDNMRILNDNGIFHYDLMSNILIERDPDGQIKFCLIDFEPDVFGPVYAGSFEDEETLERFLDLITGTNFVEESYTPQQRTGPQNKLESAIDSTIKLSNAFEDTGNGDTTTRLDKGADTPAEKSTQKRAATKPTDLAV
jgi:hypothetical protein